MHEPSLQSTESQNFGRTKIGLVSALPFCVVFGCWKRIEHH